MQTFKLLLSIFGVIFIAELPDKTSLAALVLATQLDAFAVFSGAALALAVQSMVAVIAGNLLALLPSRPVHMGAGILFLVSAIVMWRRRDEEEASPEQKSAPTERPSFWKTVSTAFTVVFIAEWGDLTQLGTAALAARYHAPITVFFGATLGLWAALAIAVFVGNRAAAYLDPERTQKVAAVIFAIIGALLLFGVV